MFGIDLPTNFRLPYLAQSCQDFWRRWHITLSEWFRDYVYIPLGGSRHRALRNLILTMTVAGVWHGAGWNFLIWGLGFGLWLAAERALGWQTDASGFAGRWLRRFAVFHLVCLLWVFFRAADFATAKAMLAAMTLPPYTAALGDQGSVVTVMALFAVFHPMLNRCFIGENFDNLRWQSQLALCAGLLYLILAFADAHLDFIYFVF